MLVSIRFGCDVDFSIRLRIRFRPNGLLLWSFLISPQTLTFIRTFEFDFQTITRSRELGSEYPKAFEDDPDGHPDEDWEVFRGRVQMLILDENGDGFRVDQVMTYKLRKDGEDLWKIIRWIDDPLSGDCGTAPKKTTTNIVESATWGLIKSKFN